MYLAGPSEAVVSVTGIAYKQAEQHKSYNNALPYHSTLDAYANADAGRYVSGTDDVWINIIGHVYHRWKTLVVAGETMR